MMGDQPKSADFVISRVFDAPRQRVWQALTEPEHMKVWWTPQTFTMIAMKMDFSPGGIFHCGMRSHEGYKLWGKFVYREIAPQERIVFVNSFSNEAGELKRHPIVPTWPLETLTTITFEEEPGGKTKLTARWASHNATDIERKTFDMSHVGMKATWGGAFDRLAAYLAKG
ncbi:MAG: SRPBCC domain-containing protein [Xanthobacteraceae bacterium]|nr:SRPBCC domain-containing protein [Xanthobacteraceae bacterium]